MTNLIKLLACAIPIYLAVVAVYAVLLIMGYIMIPIAAASGAYVKTSDNLEKPADGPIYHFTWKIMWLWDNDVDGIANKNYWVAPTNLPKSVQMFMQIFYWSAMRNPVNNARLLPFFRCIIDKDRVKFIGSKVNDVREYDYNRPLWYFAWQGWQSNFRVQFNVGDSLWRFWIGWKIYPEDSVYPVTSYRKDGTGFATQFKKLDKSRLTQ